MKNKKLNIFVMAFLIIAGLFLSSSGAVSAAGMQGEGTEAAPYLIRTVEDFFSISDNPDAHYKLMNNLDMENNELQPIEIFRGVLDGNNFTIKNSTLNLSGLYGGLIGKAEGATIQNFTLENVNLSNPYTGGNGGAMVGHATDSTIKNITVKSSEINGYYAGMIVGYAKNSNILLCRSESSTFKGTQVRGGIIGRAENSLIKQCSSNISIITNTNTFAGGIVGDAYTTIIEQCYFTGTLDPRTSSGTVGGGIVATGTGTIRDCYTNFLSTTNKDKRSLIVGKSSNFNIERCYGASNEKASLTSSTGTITDSYFDSDTSRMTTPVTQARTTEQMYQKANYENWDFDTIWSIEEGKDYPVLRFRPESVNGGNEGGNENPEPSDYIMDMVLEVGEKLLLSVDEHLSENINMNWSSSNAEVATVDSNGIVTALKAGETTITVKSKNGNYIDIINILVVDDADDFRLAVDLKVGESCRATVDKNKHTAKVTWACADEAVATVSSKGKITAQGEGLTYVTASDESGNVVGKVYIRVRQ